VTVTNLGNTTKDICLEAWETGNIRHGCGASSPKAMKLLMLDDEEISKKENYLLSNSEWRVKVVGSQSCMSACAYGTFQRGRLKPRKRLGKKFMKDAL